MTFTGKDNSPIDLKILDDNTLSFEGVQGQVFSISPILNSGDIFSVNDISGVQSMAINADGTISMNAQTKSVTITNSASNVSNLILENTNADEVDGPILEFYRNTVSPADGGDAGTLLFTGQDDGGNKQEYGRITMEFDDVSNSGEEGELIFRLTEAGSAEQEYFRLRGSSRQIEFNTLQDDIDLVWNSDSENDGFYCNAGTSRVGIGTNSPDYKLDVEGDIGVMSDGTAGTAITFGGNASTYIYSSTSGSDMTIRADDDLFLRADDELYLQSGGTTTMTLLSEGRVGIGITSPAKTLAGDIGLTGDIYVAENKKIYFDSTDSYIYADTDSSEDLHIGSDGHIELEPDNDLIVKAGSTEYVRFDGSEQRVGIGTTAPEDKLHISAGNLIFDTSGQQSSSDFAAHSKILFRDEADSTTRTMAGIGAERTAWSNSPHDLVFYTGNLSGDSSEDFDESTEKLRITDTGSIKTPLGNLNTCVVFGYNRTDMNSGAVNLKALVVESASTQNVWGHVMPKTGRIKMFAIRTNNHQVTGTNAQTWKINRNNQNGGTAGTDHFQITVAKGATQNDTGVTGNATMELTQTAHSATIWKGSVVTNLAFSAGDEIRIQRTNANNVNMGDVSGQIFVEFD